MDLVHENGMELNERYDSSPSESELGTHGDPEYLPNGKNLMLFQSIHIKISISCHRVVVLPCLSNILLDQQYCRAKRSVLQYKSKYKKVGVLPIRILIV